MAFSCRRLFVVQVHLWLLLISDRMFESPVSLRLKVYRHVSVLDGAGYGKAPTIGPIVATTVGSGLETKSVPKILSRGKNKESRVYVGYKMKRLRK